MAKSPELETYSGYINKQQKEKLLIFCEKNNITKAKAIGLLIDSIDLETLKSQRSRLDNLEIDFSEYKESSLKEVREISHRLDYVETILNKLDNLKTVQTVTQLPQTKSVHVDSPKKILTEIELAELLAKSIKTVTNNRKNIENYTLKNLGYSYSYNSEKKNYYLTNLDVNFIA
jgi:DNA/RNA endonuclease G (NUC1)